MKKILFALLFAGACANLFGQLNMTLLDQIDYTQELNDIWGWVDPDDGTEYAIVGTVTGVSVVSLADPNNVVEVAFLPGANSTWRDIKTWGNYAYVTNETSGGLMVIDLTDAPNNITATDWTPSLPGLGTYNSSHNLYIDEFGYCYIAGANVNQGGMLIVDVFTTPGMPQFVVAAPAVYSHDVYVRNNLMYSSEIYEGNLTVYDVTNKNSIVTLGQQETPYQFTHNAWLNDAGDVVFTTDEKANAPIAAYDVSDLSDIQELDQFRPIQTLGMNVIPHNVHVWNDWLIISYYTDGGIIADASRPNNIIEVGNWDSFLGGNGGFDGAWGAYPFLPSGLVLLSDISNGLFVCGANYVRACWLEGEVTDAVTGLPVPGASVHIASSQANSASSSLDGTYKTGQALPGVFDVTFSANGYVSLTTSATLENGVLTILDVQLQPLPTLSFSGQTVRALDGTPIASAKILLKNAENQFATQSDVNGNFLLPAVFAGNYELIVGAWGYITEKIDLDINSGTIPPVVALEYGYYDDFSFDFNWTTIDNAPRGVWELGEPVGTVNGNNFSNPDLDLPNDFSDQCYVTGNGGGEPGEWDLDNGSVTLISPVMDLTLYNSPKVKYSTWFYNAGGQGTPNDSLVVKISNGSTTVTLETITQSAGQWKPESQFELVDLLPITSTMTVSFTAYDLNPQHLVEAAVDGFHVDETAAYPIFTSDVISGCAPATIQFFDSSDTTFLWNWTFEGGTPATSTAQNPVVTYATPGVYDVTLTAITQTASTFTVERPNYIAISGPPTADFSSVLNGNSASFTNNSSNATSYQWDFGDGGTSTDANPTHVFAAPGQYEVTLEATNACGFTVSTQSVTVEVSGADYLDETGNSLTASPNPFGQNLTVSYILPEGKTNANLLIFNILGEKIGQTAISANAGNLSLNNQFSNSGVYFLRLQVDGKMSKALRVVKL